MERMKSKIKYKKNSKCRGEAPMNRMKEFYLLALGTVFILTVGNNGFSQDERSDLGFQEELSYTQDQTWYSKQGWNNGLSEVTQSRQVQPWRQATWTERVDYFIAQLRDGDRDAFMYVEYALLDGYANPYTHLSVQGYPTDVGSERSQGFLWKIHRNAERLEGSVEMALTGGDEEVRENVIQAVLSGLFNKDPRVRLIAINLLRRLRPDSMMARDVRRALALETVTTERSKFRDKDIDIPSVENPRLGWGAMARVGRDDLLELSDRYRDGSLESMEDLLNGNGKGLYLQEGLYQGTEINDRPVVVSTQNYTTQETTERRVWTKASLLRYGADEQISGFETDYGFPEQERIPKTVYLYIAPEGNIYYSYHSVWEELKKLDLFVSRNVWVDRVKQGDLRSLKIISKDTFRTLSDQIDGESLDNVPLKSPSFKVLGSGEVKALIVGMLENRVISTREELVRFLKRLYIEPSTGREVKMDISKALKEARRRELIRDVIRGRHLHGELQLLQADVLEEDDIDMEDTSFRMEKPMIEKPKMENLVEQKLDKVEEVKVDKVEEFKEEVPQTEERDVIFHDRSPGQEKNLKERLVEKEDLHSLFAKDVALI